MEVLGGFESEQDTGNFENSFYDNIYFPPKELAHFAWVISVKEKENSVLGGLLGNEVLSRLNQTLVYITRTSHALNDRRDTGRSLS